MVKMGGASNSLPMSNAAVRQNTGFKSCHDCLVSPWPLFHADTMLKSWSRYVYTSNIVQSCAEFQIKVHWQQFVQATSWRITLSASTQHLTSRVDDTDRNEMIWDMGLVQGWFHSLWSFYWYTVKLPIGGEWWWLWPSWKAWWGGAILPFPFQRPPVCWSHISRRRLSKLLLQDIIIYCHS